MLTIDDLVVDPGSRRCHIGSREVTLRAKEFDLLWLLMQHSGSVVTRLELMSQVWDENWSGSTKTLDVTMAGSAAPSARGRAGRGRDACRRSRPCVGTATGSTPAPAEVAAG